MDAQAKGRGSWFRFRARRRANGRGPSRGKLECELLEGRELPSGMSQAALMQMEKRLQHDLLKLGRDIALFQKQVQVAPAVSAALKTDGQALSAQVNTVANLGTLRQFARDVKGFGGAPIPDAQKTVLRSDLAAIFRSEGVTDSNLIDKTSSDEIAVIESPGLTSRLLQRLIADEIAVTVDAAATGGTWPGAPLL